MTAFTNWKAAHILPESPQHLPSFVKGQVGGLTCWTYFRLSWSLAGEQDPNFPMMTYGGREGTALAPGSCGIMVTCEGLCYLPPLGRAHFPSQVSPTLELNTVDLFLKPQILNFAFIVINFIL